MASELHDSRLREALSRPQCPGGDGWEVAVRGYPRLVETAEAAEVVICAVCTRGGVKEVWAVSIPVDISDLNLDPDVLGTTLRANLEEWWVTRHSEPRVAAWGVRRR
jgi:hypothetical protein